MTIGLLSDTHGFFDETLAIHFRDCDEIWHAGDIGSREVIDALEKIKPVVAVFGNIDDLELCGRYPEDQWLTRDGVNIWITHIAGRPPGYNPRVKRMLKDRKPAVLICGHSHICEVKKDESNQLLFINPGAAGQQGFHAMRTAMRLEIASGKISKLEVIELGKRGMIRKG
ncbi:MAG: metallophosphoesterase family protein [Cyclobacteriaceae bacterium]|nr:metallophosphoesterase family protein [Cyclobacteriaceae bacterium]